MTSTYVSHADLGGTTGHGPIEQEREGVVFHHDWEARALALTLAAGAPGGWNIDMSRSAREVRVPTKAHRILTNCGATSTDNWAACLGKKAGVRAVAMGRAAVVCPASIQALKQPVSVLVSSLVWRR